MDAAGGAEAAHGGIEGTTDPCSSSSGCRLSVHQIAGGGKGSFFFLRLPVLGLGSASRIGLCPGADMRAADIILWKRGRVTFGVIFGATMAWLLFEKSGVSFLTICCDVLLILIVVQFIRVKMADMLNRQPRPLPELVLSEEMVSNAAASFRVKVNNMLMIAHDITLGKDFRLFFQVVLVLWLLSVVGTIALVTVPALYNKYQRHVDRYAGMVHRNISRHYKIVDENVISRLPRSFARDKDE
ncbi:hypothetical protein PR202_gb19795 [Eleusine coracana subsp. coracana]|uniref:Reticulon-like protein n=1 Tax=Eleusine coracana subsp. coracana TaxID=191504 RepID=A0AAV5F901_ELECO|nr:hypothetical protein PR202_gb19795 [Eleusine coracana subsp. coracana]